ncbi:MAG: redoxin domain-containing protein [Myxococcales bacterium]|nr:redoxin domain-containing protein [Myxococcales bacterium]MCB9578430.1 redoxin domain-containing protein [Polyangiaceae bacterium]
MRQQESELETLGVDVCVVTFSNDFMARAYVEETGLVWPLLEDPERALYQAYDMLKASFWDVWGPSTWLAYAREMWRGQKLKESDEDVNQRGGDVLIDPDGIVRIHHVGKGPADRPSVESLLDVVRAAPTKSAS